MIFLAIYRLQILIIYSMIFFDCILKLLLGLWKYNKYIIANWQMSVKDFVIIAKLGQGAYSSVYKVQRIVDSQIYALKKVKMNNLSDKEQENALNQVRILASLNSPYLVSYKQSFIESNSLQYIYSYTAQLCNFQMMVIFIKKQWHIKNKTLNLIRLLFGKP